ncbi:ADP-ribosylglycohydrolase [[Emmonsia] crescens]|uniref:ADP-ribosylhydrolase ARH3 n=1 Tax=[Emmonsia] crescens TaxID=73230 RepID=A0A0G2I5C7_9EURO|nr:ADP-ribosylglycohydrolase [Emmonsia crescens UAMH 3008]
MVTKPLASKIKGSIFGVAVVDALGGPVEFQPRGSFPPVTGFRHNHNFNVPPGTWTDDTSMTLCLAQSLIENRGAFIAQTALRNYINWYQHGYLSATGDCFDIGTATTKALLIWGNYFEKTTNLEKGDPNGHLAGQPDVDKALKKEMFCGNGSLMRVAPIGLVYSNNIDVALKNAALSSNVTHPYPTCAECCVIYTKLIVQSLNGVDKEGLAQIIANTTFVDEKVKERLRHYTSLKDWESRDTSDIKSSGYVVSTLEAALWAFFRTTTFRKGALDVVNLGYDADTVGAVYGGLAGAYYGVEDIPIEWVEGLQQKEIVDRVACGLASLRS